MIRNVAPDADDFNIPPNWVAPGRDMMPLVNRKDLEEEEEEEEEVKG